ncbi:Nn.00g065700.m01.CDS01 [Neocucurbitaria sp. VM-36]
MFRRPGAGRSKASADTLCQKCLKRGHYSYECKASAQERPYTSRPSRTQQLLNPKLKPKLTTEVPNELLRKKGVADDILKKKEEARKRSRSLSSSSVDSVSTISTNRSPSRSPPRRTKDHGAASHERALGKRARRSISMDSHSSDGSHSRSRDKERDRNTRRRMSSFSPAGERGRKRTRSRSTSARMQTSHEDTRARTPRSRSGSHAKRGAVAGRRSRSRSAKRHGNRRPAARRFSVSRSRSRSPDRMDTSDDRNGAARSGRWGADPATKTAAAALPRSPSPYRGRGDRSPSPFSKRKAGRRPSPSSYAARNDDRNRGAPRGAGRNRFDNPPVSEEMPAARPPLPPLQQPVQRERSLSPYSKRLALTRQMQAG